MFKIVAKPRAWWPVTWNGVNEEGEIVENTIKLRFMLHKVDESAIIMANGREFEEKARTAFLAGEEVKASHIFAEGVRLFACDWRDVAIDDGTEGGKPLDWSDDNLATLMNEPGLFDVIMEAYKDCQRAAPKLSQGKLKAVARNWVQGRGGRAPDGDPLTAAAQVEIDRRAGRFDDGIPEIAPHESDAVTLFLSLSTQWRFEPMSGQRLGLDYAAIAPTAAMLDIRTSPALLQDLRTMEREALDTMARSR